jgi:hypothetical protein
MTGGVPVDTSDTPAQPAGTRFIDFGEQVTAAIANRAHDALGQNTDDLNTRLALWETGGLDTAYDLGAAAVPGGGRAITKDSGPVETHSALATLYDDDPANAHYRANMTSDTAVGGVGFDAVAADGLGMVGVLDRAPTGISSDTIIASGGSSATLNPASAGVDRIQLNGGARWKNGADTNLALGWELVEVSGATAGDNGIYIVDTFISDTVATVVGLDGVAASFVADDAATVTLYRRRLSSSDTINDAGALFMGEPGNLAALFAVAGQSGPADTSGATNAFGVGYRASDGVLHNGLLADRYGRLRSDLALSDTDSGEEVLWGQYGHFVDKIGATSSIYESGYIYQGPGVADLNHYGFTALFPFTDAQIPDPCAFSFTATTDEVDFTGATTAAGFQGRVVAGVTFVQILTPSAQAGYYYVNEKVGLGTTVCELRNLDGSVPVFPGAGAGTARFLAGGVLGLRDLEKMGLGATVSQPVLSLMSGLGASRGGLVIGVPGDGLADASPIQCYRADDNNEDVLFEVDRDGDVGAGGFLSLGYLRETVAADQYLPKITTEMLDGSDYQHILQARHDEYGTAAARLYAQGPSFSLEPMGFGMTSNAAHDATGWLADDVGEDASLFEQRGSILTFEVEKNPITNPFASFSKTVLGLSGVVAGASRIYSDNPRLDFNNVTAAAFGSNILPGTAPDANNLYAKNMPKAWGLIDINAGVLQAPGTANADGFNFNSVAFADANLSLLVTLHIAMSDSNYSVVVSSSRNRIIMDVERVSTSTFKIRAWDELAGANVTWNGAGITDEVFWTMFGTDAS